jgi:hypothetical protein
MGKKILFSVLLSGGVILFNTLIFPAIPEKFQATRLTAVPDLLFSYSPEFVCRFLNDIGSSGRAAYLFTSKADMIYPLFYAGLLILLTDILNTDTKKSYPFFIFPAGAALFDWAENLSMMYVLNIYPVCPGNLIRMASVFTSLKWIFVGISFLIVLYLVAIRIKTALPTK